MEIKCYEFEQMESLVERFFDNSDRAQRQKYDVVYNEKFISMGDTLESIAYSANDKIVVNTKPFTVYIKDLSGEVFTEVTAETRDLMVAPDTLRIQLGDEWNVYGLKELINTHATKYLEKDDLLMYDNRILQEDIQIAKYSIEEGSTIMLKRSEDSIKCEYYCGNCSALLMLKKSDKIICNKCFQRIIFKVPTKTRRIYDCV